ncbi:MAG TPA: HAD-IIB family hydrolase [candidate division Zixibacteria bacterium]
MTKKKQSLLIFTDLDGTLLDSDTYSFEPALPALREIKKREVPLILCSSKTRAELELCRENLKIGDPFISENGGAIFIPDDYFSHLPRGLKKKGKYRVLELGTPYLRIREKFLEVSDRLSLEVKGFGDLKIEEVSSLTNLSLSEARLAQKREYDEPFYFLKEPGNREMKLAENEFRKEGLSITRGGRFFHLTGGNDKGKAVLLLTRLYKTNRGGELLTIGLGDSWNDLPLLQVVDIPVLTRKKNNTYERDILGKFSVLKAPGIGPLGWNGAVLDLLAKPHTGKRPVADFFMG